MTGVLMRTTTGRKENSWKVLRKQQAEAAKLDAAAMMRLVSEDGA